MDKITHHTLLGTGAMAVCALNHVKDPPGAYYVGEDACGRKMFVIQAYEFGVAIGISSHHMERINTMFENLKNLAIIYDFEKAPDNYNALRANILLTLQAPASHTLTPGFVLMEKLATNSKGEYTEYGKETLETHLGKIERLYLNLSISRRHLADVYGFEDPRMWSRVNQVRDAFYKRGSAGLTDKYWDFDWRAHMRGCPQPGKGELRDREYQRLRDRLKHKRKMRKLARRRERTKRRERILAAGGELPRMGRPPSFVGPPKPRQRKKRKKAEAQTPETVKRPRGAPKGNKFGCKLNKFRGSIGRRARDNVLSSQAGKESEAGESVQEQSGGRRSRFQAYQKPEPEQN